MRIREGCVCLCAHMLCDACLWVSSTHTYSFLQKFVWFFTNVDLDLEILLEVNLNFQVQLTILLACGIVFQREHLEKFSLYPVQNIVLEGYTVFSISVIPSTFKVFIPRRTKSGGVLCYTVQTLSVGPSVLHFSALTLVSFFTYFLQTLQRHWYRVGMVWDCKWANFIQKQ